MLFDVGQFLFLHQSNINFHPLLNSSTSIRVMLTSPVFYSFDAESSVEELDWLLAKMRQAIISNPLVNKNTTNSHTASVYLASLRTRSWSSTLNIPSALTCQFFFASSQSSKGTTKHKSENLPRSRRKKRSRKGSRLRQHIGCFFNHVKMPLIYYTSFSPLRAPGPRQVHESSLITQKCHNNDSKILQT